MLADNTEELENIQNELAQKIEEEEKKMKEQMKTRKDEILAIKRQNLNERVQHAAGELSEL